MDSLTPTVSDRPAPLPREAAWGGWEVLIAIVLAVVTYIVMGTVVAVAVLAIAGELEGTPLVTGGLVGILFFDAALLGIVYLFTVQKFRLPWSALGFRSLRADFLWVPPVTAVVAHVAIVAYAVVVTAVGADALAPQQELEDLFETRAILPLTGVATVLAAPVAEEIFFRGFVFRGLIRPLNVWGAALVSGLLFGAAHISSVDTAGLIIPFSAVGMLFAWVYYRTGSLWAPMSAHFLFNLISFIVLATVVGSE
ncbi:MAG: CPBP family intramembrane glutamic endopeptidase [Dehalococcoidia bacterium]